MAHNERERERDPSERDDVAGWCVRIDEVGSKTTIVMGVSQKAWHCEHASPLHGAVLYGVYGG